MTSLKQSADDDIMEIEEDPNFKSVIVDDHQEMLEQRDAGTRDHAKTQKLSNAVVNQSSDSFSGGTKKKFSDASATEDSMSQQLLPKAPQEQKNDFDVSSTDNSNDEITFRSIKVNTQNKHRKKICCKYCFISASYQTYKNNKVQTGKYNALTFLPKNLMQQFSKMANLYFLVMMFLEMYKPISDSGGYPMVAGPLSFVVGVSMLKDAFEDIKRHMSDRRENLKKVKVVVNKMVDGIEKMLFDVIRWKEIRVGQIVKVEENEYFPCDLVLLNSSEPNGVCYVETKNLDGETNLKHKKADQLCVKLCSNDRAAINNFTNAEIECDKENEFIYKFNGKIMLPDDAVVGLGEDQILLRGSSLRNTKFIYGIAVYTGHDTKVMMNSSKSVAKKSKLEISLNKYLLMGMALQQFLCLFAAGYNTVWSWAMYKNPEETPYYLELNQQYRISALGKVDQKESINPADFLNSIENFIYSFGKWVLALMNFVAISLLVSLETVKFIQGIYIEWDVMMYDQEQDSPAKAQSSNLNEELGQVSYIFSDKTGTLTKNIMEFKKFSAGPNSYGSTDINDVIEGEEEAKRRENAKNDGITNVNFLDDAFWDEWQNSDSANMEYLQKFITILAVCHTIVPNMSEDGKLTYNASSPDELALTNGARYFGLVFEERDASNNIVINNIRSGQEEKYELLNVIEFTSLRKRMSVIVRSPDDKILCMTKGADSIILPRLHPGQESLIEKTEGFLDEYAKQGLRTLLLAQREIDPNVYQQWNEKYEHALSQLVDREKHVNRVAEEIERDLTLIGSTAIEDKLQDNVAEVISDIREAGIKFWVLTGDKIETAINIGFSCSVLDDEMEIFIIDDQSRSGIQKQLQQYVSQQKQIGYSRETAVVIGGDQLTKITQCPKPDRRAKMLNEFMILTENASVVIACRVSPKQKAEVVRLVRQRKQMEKKTVTTLAIGDGANDVNMILAAHLGVGISGLEGQQASRAADYSVCQFQHLKNLLFCHGREAYRRNSFLVLYMFYKNMLLVLPLFYYGGYSAFSGANFYDQFMYQSFNVFYTGVPVVWFAVYDWEFSKQIFLDNPHLYKIGPKNKCFSSFIFARWYFYATWQALVILIVSVWTLDYAPSFGIKIFEIFNFDGDRDLTLGVIQGSIWIDGTYILQAIVVLVTVKIFISTSSHTFWSILWQLLSVVVFYLVMIFLSVVPISLSDLLGVARPLLLFMINYLLMLITVVAFSFVDVGMWHIDQQVRLAYDQFEESLEYQLRQSQYQQKTTRGRKLTQYKHRGFGFDGAAGHDVLVTDGLMKRIQYAMDRQFQGKMTPFGFDKWGQQQPSDRSESSYSISKKSRKKKGDTLSSNAAISEISQSMSQLDEFSMSEPAGSGAPKSLGKNTNKVLDSIANKINKNDDKNN